MFARRNPWPLLLILVAFYGAVFAGYRFWRESVRVVTLSAGKKAYLHYELVDVALSTRDSEVTARWRQNPPVVTVTHDGSEVTTVAGLRRLPLREDGAAWRGLWPVPWNAEPGEYRLSLSSADALGDRLQASGFRIERRKPAPIPKGLSILTLESVTPLAEMKVKAPDGTEKDWRGLLDWAQYVGADAFWMLGGQTPGKNPGEVWVTTNLDMIPKVAHECHARGLKFGVYAMCYLTMSTRTVGGYEYARDVQEGASLPTRAISLRDPRRPRDVSALLAKFAASPDVDYVGLDYIRNALGGYELADEFFAEMPGVSPPPDWTRLSEEQRMVWFARKKIMRRDMAFIDAWQWWRAHKVGQIVNGIKARVGARKPLWAFTLTWDKGWNHGQDPVMMNDAGVDVDALMLYEATKEQYDALVGDWHRYVHRGDVQLVVGDVIDWPLHQRDPAGPGEFYRRETKAVDEIYADGPAAGVFFHDAARALWGRVGPWGTRGWMDAAKRATEYVKSRPSS